MMRFREFIEAQPEPVWGQQVLLESILDQILKNVRLYAKKSIELAGDAADNLGEIMPYIGTGGGAIGGTAAGGLGVGVLGAGAGYGLGLVGEYGLNKIADWLREFAKDLEDDPDPINQRLKLQAMRDLVTIEDAAERSVKTGALD
jgi:hypothetical protein